MLLFGLAATSMAYSGHGLTAWEVLRNKHVCQFWYMLRQHWPGPWLLGEFFLVGHLHRQMVRLNPHCGHGEKRGVSTLFAWVGA